MDTSYTDTSSDMKELLDTMAMRTGANQWDLMHDTDVDPQEDTTCDICGTTRATLTATIAAFDDLWEDEADEDGNITVRICADCLRRA